MFSVVLPQEKPSTLRQTWNPTVKNTIEVKEYIINRGKLTERIFIKAIIVLIKLESIDSKGQSF